MVPSSSHSWLHSALGKGSRMMGCFSCFESKADFHVENVEPGPSVVSADASTISAGREQLHPRPLCAPTREILGPLEVPEVNKIAAITFTFRELAGVTNNFREDSLLGEGGFGRVYKGRLRSTGQVVAVKQLDRNGLQGNREFLVEVLMLSLLHHPDLVNLIGYCAEEPLDWNTRIKIAGGAAKGLEYLHDEANPPVIYRDLKSSNILLDEGFHPKLSDFGLAKLGPTGDKSHVSTRVMGTYGYCAPEYAMTGQLTVKSDVYSFGVVLLELITGRKAIDPTRAQPEQNLVQWARPFFNDRKKLPRMADPRLEGRFPMRGLFQAIAVAAMCLHEQAGSRPTIGSVVTALSFLANQKYDPTQSIRTGKEDRRSRRVGAEEGKGRKTSTKEEGEGSAIKWDLDESDKDDSPKEAINHKRDLNREKAVAEAKIWGESWRDKKKTDAYVNTENV